MLVKRGQSMQSATSIAREKRREAACHYALIYLMIAMGDSFLYDRILFRLSPILAIVALFLVVASRKTQYVFPLSILALGTLTMLFVRSTTNAMGPSELFSWVAMICLAVVAIGFNASKFLERLILLTSALASFSVVIYLTSQVIPGIWNRITPFSFPLLFGEGYWADSTTHITTRYYQAHGLFLYVDRGFDLERNVGIFREPAVYQILLNSMVFVLLYMCPEALRGKRKVLLALFVIALITTQSATGYLLGLILFFLYFVGTIGNKRKAPRIVIAALAFGLCVLMIFLICADNSWLADTILVRFFSKDGFAMDASGNARVGAAAISLHLMADYPLGCGYDVYSAALNTESTGFLAACLFRLFAVYGIPFGIAVVAWVFYPVFANSNLPLSAKISFAIMYLLATFFEDEIFYTTLIFIPLFMYFSFARTAACASDVDEGSMGGTLGY